jgi:hypothetical protein
MTEREPKDVADEFAAVQTVWKAALEGHRLAPPDAGFSARLAALAQACALQASVLREAQKANFGWPPHGGTTKPPWELLPESGRRGPAELWRAFDVAEANLNRASRGTSLLDVADAFEQFSTMAAALAQALEREDRASGLLPAVHAARSA